jgi:hypothetical protein
MGTVRIWLVSFTLDFPGQPPLKFKSMLEFLAGVLGLLRLVTFMLLQEFRKLFIFDLKRANIRRSARGGNRTPDQGLMSPLLYR